MPEKRHPIGEYDYQVDLRRIIAVEAYNFDPKCYFSGCRCPICEKGYTFCGHQTGWQNS